MFPLICYKSISLLFQTKKKEQHGLSVSISQLSTYEDNRCLNILKNTKQLWELLETWNMGSLHSWKSLSFIYLLWNFFQRIRAWKMFSLLDTRGGWHVRGETRYEAIHQVKHSLIHSPFINDFYFLINSFSPILFPFLILDVFSILSDTPCNSPSLSFPEPSLLNNVTFSPHALTPVSYRLCLYLVYTPPVKVE